MRAPTGAASASSPTGSMRNSGAPGVDLHVAGDEDVADPPGDRRRRRRSPSSSPRRPRGGRRPRRRRRARRRRRRRAPPPAPARCRRRRGRSGGRRRRPRRGGRCPAPTTRPSTSRPPIDSRLRPRPRRSTSTTATVPSSSTSDRVGPSRPQLDPVGLAAVAQLDLAADLQRRPAAGRGWPSRGTRRGRCPASSSPASSAAATRATSAWRVGRCSSAAVSRSSHDVSMSPARTSGRSSRSSRNDLFVVPPSHDAPSSATAPGAAGRAPRRGRGRGR